MPGIRRKKQQIRFYWRSGVVEMLHGDNISEALLKAGYGLSAVTLVSFTEREPVPTCYWNGACWVRKSEERLRREGKNG